MIKVTLEVPKLHKAKLYFITGVLYRKTFYGPNKFLSEVSHCLCCCNYLFITTIKR